jgi:hypothetical protein
MVSRPDPDEVVEATAAYLTGYVGEVTDINSFVKNLDPKTNIRGLEDVLSYHYLRTGEWEPQISSREELTTTKERTAGITDAYGEPVGILDFISLLPSRLKSLDPEITNNVHITENSIEGQIDWEKTIQYRYRTGDIGPHKFACRSKEKTVHSTRNRVLVALLSTILSICSDFETNVIKGNEWPKWFEGWGPNGEYREELNRILKNPHFETVDFQSGSVSNRDISEVKTDRDRLYREAAALMEYYRGLGADWFDQHGDYAASLLSLDLFHPDEENEGADIFELYWVFKLVDCFSKTELEPFSLRGSGNYDGELLAHWKSEDSEYLLFNDWRGRYPYADGERVMDLLNINPPSYATSPIEITEESIDCEPTRVGFVEQHNKWILDAAFGQDSDSGRKTPDIVLLEMDRQKADPKIKKAFIAEVKYSTQLERTDHKIPNVVKGVKQVLEYGAYAKFGEDLSVGRSRSGKYLGSNPDPLRAPEIELGLFVGDADIVEDNDIPGIQIKGWPDEPDTPLVDG